MLLGLYFIEGVVDKSPRSAKIEKALDEGFSFPFLVGFFPFSSGGGGGGV